MSPTDNVATHLTGVSVNSLINGVYASSDVGKIDHKKNPTTAFNTVSDMKNRTTAFNTVSDMKNTTKAFNTVNGIVDRDMTNTTRAFNTVNGIVGSDMTTTTRPFNTVNGIVNSDTTNTTKAFNTVNGIVDRDMTNTIRTFNTVNGIVNRDMTHTTKAFNMVNGNVDSDMTNTTKTFNTVNEIVNRDMTHTARAFNTVNGIVDSDMTNTTKAFNAVNGIVNRDMTNTTKAFNSVNGILNRDMPNTTKAFNTVNGIVDSDMTNTTRAFNTVNENTANCRNNSVKIPSEQAVILGDKMKLPTRYELKLKEGNPNADSISTQPRQIFINNQMTINPVYGTQLQQSNRLEEQSIPVSLSNAVNNQIGPLMSNIHLKPNGAKIQYMPVSLVCSLPVLTQDNTNMGNGGLLLPTNNLQPTIIVTNAHSPTVPSMFGNNWNQGQRLAQTPSNVTVLPFVKHPAVNFAKNANVNIDGTHTGQQTANDISEELDGETNYQYTLGETEVTDDQMFAKSKCAKVDYDVDEDQFNGTTEEKYLLRASYLIEAKPYTAEISLANVDDKTDHSNISNVNHELCQAKLNRREESVLRNELLESRLTNENIDVLTSNGSCSNNQYQFSKMTKLVNNGTVNMGHKSTVSQSNLLPLTAPMDTGDSRQSDDSKEPLETDSGADKSAIPDTRSLKLNIQTSRSRARKRKSAVPHKIARVCDQSC